jgi:hypothetical protein
MEDFSDLILNETAVLASVTVIDIGLALLVTSVLNGILAKLYMMTHGGYSYSKSFVQALILVGITVALIMVIIGSDIARAFALVGAMSIVRFRTPVKDTKDLVFLFAGIAVGMACGTRFYEFAGIFVGFMVMIVLVMHYWRFGDIKEEGYVLKMRMRPGDREHIAELCQNMCERFSVVSVSRMESGDSMEDIVYEVHLKRGIKYDQLVDTLSKAVDPLSISLLVGEGTVNA